MYSKGLRISTCLVLRFEVVILLSCRTAIISTFHTILPLLVYPACSKTCFPAFLSQAGNTLFANHNETGRKFCQKNCKFTKHDENHATHYSLIVQSFAPESDFFSSHKNPFEFVMEAARLAKQDEPSFTKKRFAKCYKTLSIHYL